MFVLEIPLEKNPFMKNESKEAGTVGETREAVYLRKYVKWENTPKFVRQKWRTFRLG